MIAGVHFNDSTYFLPFLGKNIFFLMGNLPTHLHLALTRGGDASWANAHWQVRIILLRKDYFMNKDHKEALRITKKELCKKRQWL